tara:strand:- start:3814 stop:4077 length:264 start_codon:yes stop_codon:yes gene_type:complete
MPKKPLRVRGPFEEAELRANLFASNFLLNDSVSKTLSALKKLEAKYEEAVAIGDPQAILKIVAQIEEYEMCLQMTANLLEKLEGWSA